MERCEDDGGETGGEVIKGKREEKEERNVDR